jgi:hypothetical protein
MVGCKGEATLNRRFHSWPFNFTREGTLRTRAGINRLDFHAWMSFVNGPGWRKRAKTKTGDVDEPIRADSEPEIGPDTESETEPDIDNDRPVTVKQEPQDDSIASRKPYKPRQRITCKAAGVPIGFEDASQATGFPLMEDSDVSQAEFEQMLEDQQMDYLKRLYATAAVDAAQGAKLRQEEQLRKQAEERADIASRDTDAVKRRSETLIVEERQRNESEIAALRDSHTAVVHLKQQETDRRIRDLEARHSQDISALEDAHRTALEQEKQKITNALHDADVVRHTAICKVFGQLSHPTRIDFRIQPHSPALTPPLSQLFPSTLHNTSKPRLPPPHPPAPALQPQLIRISSSPSQTSAPLRAPQQASLRHPRSNTLTRRTGPTS